MVMLRRFRRPNALSNFILSMTSAGLLVVSQSPYGLGPVATVALVPWLIAVRRSGAFAAIGLSVGLGVVSAMVGANWLFAAFESQGVHGFRNMLVVMAAALWGKGLLFGTVGWFVQRLGQRANRIRLIAPAAVFGLGEYWISHSPWGLPLLLLGHSQHSVPGVAQLAVAIGVPGISSLLFAMNAAFAAIVIGTRSDMRAAIALGVPWAAGWFAVAMGGLPIARAFEPAVRGNARTLLIVQPNIPPRHRWKAAYQGMILDEVAAETSRAIANLGQTPDVILWPENLLTLPVTPENDLGRRLQSHLDDWGAPGA